MTELAPQQRTALCSCHYLPHAVNCLQRLVEADKPPTPRFAYTVREQDGVRGREYRLVRVCRRTGRRWDLATCYTDPYIAYAVAIMLSRYAGEET